MNRFHERIQRMRVRIRNRYVMEETHHIKEDLDCEITDEIEKALLDIKDAMDIPTEEIDKAIVSRTKNKGDKNVTNT